jgi:hypothetical protein
LVCTPNADPFGNYLCQKLLEQCSDHQRGEIVDLVARDLIPISLNMHGTRAVQKLIEFVNIPTQVCCANDRSKQSFHL